MVLCNEKCLPCCDYCIYVMTERIPYNGKMINGRPVGCFKNHDEEHNKIAESCGYCKDFHCRNMKLKQCVEIEYV